jgi:beta-carotene ketolase (CrtW type)
MSVERTNTGVIAAISVISAWSICIMFLMNRDIHLDNFLIYPMILVQMHLYTGLFITAHDAMHGTVSHNKTLNNFIGQLCTFLYACFPFKKLYKKHHEHHAHVHTDKDPDYHEGSIFVWYFNFVKEYTSWWQLVAMAVLFNILKLWVPESNLFLFWVLPSLLSTVQLFYFGTWLPHHGEHDNIYQSRTQKRNHFYAFITCYFFGYHYEHHDSPHIPWWNLWKLKKG